MKKLFLMLLAAAGLLFAGCGTVERQPDALAAVRERGVLRVGSTGDYDPMSFRDPATGKYRGFDAALAEGLARDLGVKIEYVRTSWPTLMKDTLDRKFDLALCGITITPGRKARALMSDGYLRNGKTVLCRAEDAGKYTSLAAIDRPGVRVMENPGGLNERFARKHLPHATLVIHPVNWEIPALIASGKADVMITEIMEAACYCSRDPRLAAPLLDSPFTHGELGALLPPGNETLRDHVNRFIVRERQSGHLDQLKAIYIPGCGTAARRRTGWREYKIYCGMSSRKGSVSEADWNRFCDRYVSPAFPDGYTVLDAAGHWRPGTGPALKEKTKIIVVAAPAGDLEKVRETARRYREQFDQESVLISYTDTTTECIGSDGKK